MRPKATFDSAMKRVDHLLRLYDLLHNTRTYKARSDWCDKFNDLMHWPKRERLVRVDGKDSASILILRQALGLDASQFTHDYLSELLRSAVVATVSALDRYMHDVILHHSWPLLSRADDRVPSEFRKLTLPILATKHALNRLKSAPTSRPGHLVKAALQEQLHRDHTFQRPDDLAKAARMLGIEDFWSTVAGGMPGAPPKPQVIATLRLIAVRRNQIVHEADIMRKTKAKKVSLRDISRKKAEEWCLWMRDLVTAIDKAVDAAV